MCKCTFHCCSNWVVGQPLTLQFKVASIKPSARSDLLQLKICWRKSLKTQLNKYGCRRMRRSCIFEGWLWQDDCRIWSDSSQAMRCSLLELHLRKSDIATCPAQCVHCRVSKGGSIYWILNQCWLEHFSSSSNIQLSEHSFRVLLLINNLIDTDDGRPHSFTICDLPTPPKAENSSKLTFIMGNDIVIITIVICKMQYAWTRTVRSKVWLLLGGAWVIARQTLGQIAQPQHNWPKQWLGGGRCQDLWKTFPLHFAL